MSLSPSEFDNTVRLVAVANTTATNDKTYNECKAAVTTAFKKLVKDCRLPFIEYGDNKVRVLVASIGSVVYIVIPSHATAMEYEAQASSLGIVGLATAMLGVPEMDKVILCGHGHGGGVAHVAHKQLESSNGAFKVASVALGAATSLPSRTTGSTFYTVCPSDDTADATDASFDKLSKRPDVKDYSTQHSEATPTVNTEASQKLHQQMMMIAPQHLASADFDVHGALKQFFASVKQLGKKGNTKAELETIATNIEKTEAQWKALIEFLDGTQTTNESKMPWQALSDSDISLSELVRLTTMLLAVNIMRDEYGAFELVKDIVKPVLAIAGAGALVATGISAVASVAALFTSLSLGAALGATAGATGVFVGSGIGLVATEASDFSHGFVALVRHCQSESYK
ncbi:hypothetical protein SPRG_10542 [Saprolegnia parasitica CBS 223.65]|uniref:Uncharacterized protein n=1 Tax=Saprolegnia parasitica (strain CBS 223.65) TaxID=695850 RepID=A0A067C3R7_SAPPC|nr:hypothetical protein SPRG_10542 [Saprolegnia parasitica CBS 223.65]KDO23765.1 hypothetical protein SPRG_10542 [Saprolegnia parasitica CBS 223.65]|eukprot:XP_012205580.1 hypothetical protein SPRG_10542 [Saprolegnia parasitica CBS 223.65]